MLFSQRKTKRQVWNSHNIEKGERTVRVEINEGETMIDASGAIKVGSKFKVGDHVFVVDKIIGHGPGWVIVQDNFQNLQALHDGYFEIIEEQVRHRKQHTLWDFPRRNT